MGHGFIDDSLRHHMPRTDLGKLAAHPSAFLQYFPKATQFEQAIAAEEIGQQRIALPAIAAENLSHLIEQFQRFVVAAQHQVG